MEPQVWTREKIRQVLEELSKMSDFDLIPIPESIAKEYNIPFTPAKTLHLKEYLKEHQKTVNAPTQSYEIRESDTILRTLKEEEPLKITVCKPEEVDQHLKPQD